MGNLNFVRNTISGQKFNAGPSERDSIQESVGIIRDIRQTSKILGLSAVSDRIMQVQNI